MSPDTVVFTAGWVSGVGDVFLAYAMTRLFFLVARLVTERPDAS